MACRLGVCEINNNRQKIKKKPTPKSKKPTPVMKDSSSDWSDSDESCSGCSDCCGSSSTCSCSECNMETDSSDNACYASACGPKLKKPVKKTSKNNNKVLRCTDGVCEWVSKKKLQKPRKTKNPAPKRGKAKNNKTTKNCYECC